MHIMRLDRAPVLALAILCLASLPGTAQEIETALSDEGIRLAVAGRFYEFRVERSPAPEGPYELLGWRHIGCTEACEWIDSGVEEGATYYYRFELLDSEWRPVRLGPTAVTTPALTGRILASTAHPSPFSDETTISFRIPNRLAPSGDAPSRVSIIDASGRTIRLLHQGAIARGAHSLEWDGRDGAGRRVPSGSYWYRIEAADAWETGRVVRLP